MEASKTATRALTAPAASGGRPAPAPPVAELACDAGVVTAYAAALRRSVGAEAPVEQ